MINENYDIIVIGGGPAGTTLSMLSLRQGYRVLLLEREKFPRFHVGESLLPASQLIWQKLGIAESIRDLNQTYKDGAEFQIGLDPSQSKDQQVFIDFTDPLNWPQQDFPEHPYAYQVNRSEFDGLLLKQACAQGVEVVEEAVVKKIIWEGDRATGIQWRSQEGQHHTTTAQCIADCSGRQALIARHLDCLKTDPYIQTSAVFGHFRGVKPNPGRQQGAITVYFIENGWVWLIPLSSGMMSVGVVMNQPNTQAWSKKSPEEILLTYINQYPFLRDRFATAEQVSKIRILRELSYAAQQTVGDGWLLVGDANFFVDPLLSSGVQVAFKTADKAADAIHAFLQNNRDMRSFKRYQRWGKIYRFHIFVTMRLLYQMMRTQFAMGTFVKAVHKTMTQGSNPIRRRFTAWTLGHFDRFYGSLYLLWFSFSFLSRLGVLRQEYLHRDAWEKAAADSSDTPLRIPKSLEYSVISPSAKAS